jgi:hypothetical protein
MKQSRFSAIWYDSLRRSYLLPLKSEVRKSENLKDRERIHVTLQLEEQDVRLGLFTWREKQNAVSRRKKSSS